MSAAPRHAPHPYFNGTRDDSLLVGNTKLTDIAREIGRTPFYLYSRAALDARVRELREALPDSVHLHYAVKANPMPELVAAAADNFFLDHDLAHRRAELNNIRAAIGMPMHHGEFVALNALRGKWRVEHEAGWVDVFLTLAPTMPPTIQYLTLTMGKEEPT